jgi:hypothetical protein
VVKPPAIVLGQGILGMTVFVVIMFSWNLTAVILPPPFLEGLSKKVFLPVVSFISEGVGASIDAWAVWRQKVRRNFTNLLG